MWRLVVPLLMRPARTSGSGGIQWKLNFFFSECLRERIILGFAVNLDKDICEVRQLGWGCPRAGGGHSAPLA